MALVDDIREEKTHLEQKVWAQAWARWRQNAAYYNMTAPIWDDTQTAQSRPTRRPGIWSALVDHAVSYQVSDQPKIKRYPVGKGAEHKERADRVENFLYVVFERMLRDAIDPPIRAGYRSMFTYGYMQYDGPRITPIPREMAEARESEVRGWMPFSVEAVPPTEILLQPYSKYPDHGIRVSKMFAHEVERLSIKKAEQGRGKVWKREERGRFEEVKVWEYFDFQRHLILTDGGEVIVDEPNLWGIVPYKHAFSGWGGRPAGEEGFDPAYLAKGLYDPVKDTLKLVAQHYTGKAANLIDTVFQHYRVAGRDVETVLRQLNTPNAVVEAAEGEVGRIAGPELPGHLFRQTAELMQDIELSTYAFTLIGLRQEGVDTVGQQAILSNAAQRIFAAPRKQMEGMMSLIAGDILRLMEVLRREYGIERLRLGGESLSLDDIEGDYNVEVTFEVLDPLLHMQEKQLAMSEFQAGLISWEDYQRIARREDLSNMKRRIIEDGVWKALAEHAKAVALQEVGKLDIAEQIAEQARKMGTAVSGRVPEMRQPLSAATPKPPIMTR